jgi:hypothetical protein
LRQGECRLDVVICYCYRYTEDDIKNDLLKNNGNSTILENIIYNRKYGLCKCDDNHPQHR